MFILFYWSTYDDLPINSPENNSILISTRISEINTHESIEICLWMVDMVKGIHQFERLPKIYLSN